MELPPEIADWPENSFEVVHKDGSRAIFPSRAYLQKLINDTVNNNASTAGQRETKMSETVVSPVAGQPFVVTGSNHDGHGRHSDHSDTHLAAATLREAVASQRETNASFRASDSDRSRNAIANEQIARESERNHARTREDASRSEARILDAIKAEANVTRDLMHRHENARMTERAQQAEAKLAALYAAGTKPGAPTL